MPNNLPAFPPRPDSLAHFGTLLRTARKCARSGAGMTLDELARLTEISKPYLSNIETARAPGPPSEDKLRRLAAALEIDAASLLAAADWLRTPESVRRAYLAAAGGDAGRELPRREDGTINLDRMISRSASGSAAPAPAAGVASTHDDSLPIRNIPLINRVAAGKPGEFGDLSYPAGVADAYVPAPDLPDAPPKHLFALRVVGDSMLPEYREGDILIVGPGEAKDGDDCVVRTGASANFATTFKRLFFIKGADGAPTAARLVPLNPAFPEQTLALEDITGIYPLVYRLVPARASKAAAVKASAKLRT